MHFDLRIVDFGFSPGEGWTPIGVASGDRIVWSRPSDVAVLPPPPVHKSIAERRAEEAAAAAAAATKAGT